MGSKFDRGDQSEQEGQPTLEKQVNNGEQQLNGDETGAGLNRLMWTRLMTILKPFFSPVRVGKPIFCWAY